MLSEWERAAVTYANISDIILASADVVEQRTAVLKIMTPSGYPTFARIARGKSTEITVTRTYEQFCAEAELIRKQNLLNACRFYTSFTPVDFPAVVLATPPAERHSCTVLEQVCARASVPFARCFLDKRSSEQYNLTFIYTDVNITIGNLSVLDLPKFSFDFFREPFGNWDIAGGRRSTRRMLVLVYGYAWQIADVKGIAVTFVRDFALGRIAFEDFAMRARTSAYAVEDTPLYVVSNAERSRYLLWSDVNDTRTLRERLAQVRAGAFDAAMSLPMNELIPNMSTVWVWAAAAVGALLIGGFVWKKRPRPQKVE
jgi:hypothetical protein